MKKNSKITDVYKPNSYVTVTVVNKPEIISDEDSGAVVYDATVTIKINAGKNRRDKLVFAEDDSIAKFIETVDFEDPQTQLGLESED